MVQLIVSFLNNKTFQIKIKDKKSSTRFSKTGVLQGSVLSLLLLPLRFWLKIGTTWSRYTHILQGKKYVINAFRKIQCNGNTGYQMDGENKRGNMISNHLHSQQIKDIPTTHIKQRLPSKKQIKNLVIMFDKRKIWIYHTRRIRKTRISMLNKNSYLTQTAREKHI